MSGTKSATIASSARAAQLDGSRQGFSSALSGRFFSRIEFIKLLSHPALGFLLPASFQAFLECLRKERQFLSVYPHALHLFVDNHARGQWVTVLSPRPFQIFRWNNHAMPPSSGRCV